ncbi:MAG: hypothetical protein CW338_07290 [Clostridiales bacterium]|nr:hypothetical protein [Clostridiales bacterium]
MMSEEKLIRTDRMKYVKNVQSSRLCYLAILLDVLFFVSIYESDVGNWYYRILIGASIVYNLIFMMLVFLASEGVKSYKMGYTWVLYALAAIQILRVFIIPQSAHSTFIAGASGTPGAAYTAVKSTFAFSAETWKSVETFIKKEWVMGNGQYIRCLIYLISSAVSLAAAAVVNHVKCVSLARHIRNTQTATEEA